MRILLIEDEKKIASFVKRGLKEEHYTVDVAYDGEKGLFLAGTSQYDLIIIDIMLLGKNGINVCREIRSEKVDVPILFLSAKSGLNDKIFGLDAGADDYLSKPFAFEELLARIRALLRRKRENKTTTLIVSDLTLDQISHTVMRGGKQISLTSKEYSLLEYFMLNAEHVVTRTMISEHVWNEDFDSFSNVIDVYVKYLRNKVDKGFKKQLIHSIRGTGYMLAQKKK
ncbi:MAG: response regulator transcription factor [Candidatus Omnitrophica bacterium]|nr:response regulator transcription factor [Candidatus Omnitrophota bacterium]